MARDRPRKLRMAARRQPRGRTVAVGERAGRVVRRQDLVDVVEQGRGLDEPLRSTAIPLRLDPRRQEARDLGDGARVRDEPGSADRGREQGGGLHPPGDGHRLDGTRRPSGRASAAAGRPCADDGGAWATRLGARRRRPASRTGGSPRPATVALRTGAPAAASTPRPRRRARGRRRRRGVGPDRQPARLEGHGHRAVDVGPEDPRAGVGQAFERRPRRVAVRVVGTGRGDRDPRPDGGDERLGRRGPAAVMGDLEQVDPRQALASSDGSTSSSTSPVSRNRRSPTSRAARPRRC